MIRADEAGRVITERETLLLKNLVDLSAKKGYDIHIV